MFPRKDNRNEGTFACFPERKTGTRVHSPKPHFYETALLSPREFGGVFQPMKYGTRAASFIQRIAKGAGGKGPRQKTSKIVRKCQKVFRHFSTIFAQGKKRQKSSKSVKNIFDTFRQFSRVPFFPAPFAIR